MAKDSELTKFLSVPKDSGGVETTPLVSVIRNKFGRIFRWRDKERVETRVFKFRGFDKELALTTKVEPDALIIAVRQLGENKLEIEISPMQTGIRVGTLISETKNAAIGATGSPAAVRVTDQIARRLVAIAEKSEASGIAAAPPATAEARRREIREFLDAGRQIMEPVQR